MLFFKQLKAFNDMYKLPNGNTPTLSEVGDPVQRLLQFTSILRKELAECDEIIAGIHAGRSDADTLTDISDLLGDIMVYAGSEAGRFGVPIQAVLEAGIMESNFSKLGADGMPIYDNEMKVQKGPNYWKPEPRIKAIIQLARGEEITPYVSYKEFMATSYVKRDEYEAARLAGYVKDFAHIQTLPTLTADLVGRMRPNAADGPLTKDIKEQYRTLAGLTGNEPLTAWEQHKAEGAPYSGYTKTV